MGKKIFYFGWIPIVIAIIAVKFFLMTNSDALAIQYIEKHKKNIRKSTNEYMFSPMYNVNNKVFIDMKLKKMSIDAKKDRKEFSESFLKGMQESGICENRDTISYLSKGVVLQYSCYDRTGNNIVSIIIDKKFCKER